MRNDNEQRNESHRGQEARESGRPGNGAGRSDEVRGSGVHPASAGDAPDDAPVRTPGEWGEGAGGEEGGRSEIRMSEEELRAAEEGETNREPGGSA